MIPLRFQMAFWCNGKPILKTMGGPIFYLHPPVEGIFWYVPIGPCRNLHFSHKWGVQKQHLEVKDPIGITKIRNLPFQNLHILFLFFFYNEK